MPYNNTPIDPADDVKGSTHLPMSRVKKVLAVDDEISQVSNHGVFLCTRAAELFVRTIVKQAFEAERARSGAGGSSGKPFKKQLQYDDIARVIHRTDNLEFLCDVIPESTTYGRHKRDKRRKENALAEKKAKRANLAVGQTTLDGSRRGSELRAGPDSNEAVAPSRPSTSAAAPLDAVLNSEPGNSPIPLPPHGPDAQLLNGAALVSREIKFKHYEPRANGIDSNEGDEDVHMAD